MVGVPEPRLLSFLHFAMFSPVVVIKPNQNPTQL